MFKVPTPWRGIVRTFFNGKTPNLERFAKNYGLDRSRLIRLNAGIETAFWPELCAALHDHARQSGRDMSHGFFQRFSDRWEADFNPPLPPAASDALAPPGRLFFHYVGRELVTDH